MYPITTEGRLVELLKQRRKLEVKVVCSQPHSLILALMIGVMARPRPTFCVDPLGLLSTFAVNAVLGALIVVLFEVSVGM